MTTFQRYKEEKRKFLETAHDYQGGGRSDAWLVQAAREMVLAEMEWKAAKEFPKGPLFGLPLEWIDWLKSGGSRK